MLFANTGEENPMTKLLIPDLLLCLALAPGLVCADADSEREALARLAHELTALEPLIREAEAQTNHDARIRFQYNWLRQDLSRIRMGIQEHINAPRTEPRQVEPLRGDYRR
jgi:RAQPRD family integrative conjugative element protein